MLGWNRGSPILGIHGLKGGSQAVESKLDHWADAANQMIDGNQLLGCDCAQHRQLARCGTAHTGPLQDVSKTKISGGCRQLIASRARAHARETFSTPCLGACRAPDRLRHSTPWSAQCP